MARAAHAALSLIVLRTAAVIARGATLTDTGLIAFHYRQVKSILCVVLVRVTSSTPRRVETSAFSPLGKSRPNTEDRSCEIGGTQQVCEEMTHSPLGKSVRGGEGVELLEEERNAIMILSHLNGLTQHNNITQHKTIPSQCNLTSQNRTYRAVTQNARYVTRAGWAERRPGNAPTPDSLATRRPAGAGPRRDETPAVTAFPF